MKTVLAVAAGALLGLAEAGIHKMKLQKVPLAEQLVSNSLPPLDTSMLMLQPRNMPISPLMPRPWARSTWVSDLKGTGKRCSERHPSIRTETITLFPSATSSTHNTSPRLLSVPLHRRSKSSSIPDLPTSGFRHPSAALSLAICTPNMTPQTPQPTRRMVRTSRSDMARAVSVASCHRTLFRSVTSSSRTKTLLKPHLSLASLSLSVVLMELWAWAMIPSA